MTIEEFNNTRFGAGMKVKYMNEEYFIKSTDFEEALIGMVKTKECKRKDMSWARCENCELIIN